MTDPDRSTAPHRDTSDSPYGPHRGHVDEASGGADSSPFDNLPSDERRQAAADPAFAPGPDTGHAPAGDRSPSTERR